MGILATKYGARGSIGEAGEQEVYDKLRSLGYTVIDYRLDLIRQQYGIDFGIIEPSTGTRYFIDVKTNLKAGKFYLEFEDDDGSPGWFYTTKSDEIYHYDISGKVICTYNIAEMRAYVFNNYHTIQPHIYNGIYRFDTFHSPAKKLLRWIS